MYGFVVFFLMSPLCLHNFPVEIKSRPTNFKWPWGLSLAVGVAAPPSMEVPPLVCFKACPQVTEGLRPIGFTGPNLCSDCLGHFGTLQLEMFAEYV